MYNIILNTTFVIMLMIKLIVFDFDGVFTDGKSLDNNSTQKNVIMEKTLMHLKF